MAVEANAMDQTTGIRDFLRGPAGRAATVGFLLVAVGVAGLMIWSTLRTDPSVAAYEEPPFIDATTGKVFHKKLSLGMSFPIKAPSGDMAGYPAELCYWTKDGQPMKEPTPVLLNSWINKPDPTFCPVCGRLVVQNNPTPTERPTPPPTEAEYKARHGG